MPTSEDDLKFRMIRKTFLLFCQEREKQAEIYGEESAKVWKRYYSAVSAGILLSGAQLWARDLFARIYTELWGDPKHYEHYLSKIFDPPFNE